MKRLRRFLDPLDLRDLFVFGGIALISAGAGMVYLPAALVVAGIALLTIGIFGVPGWA